MLELEFFKIKYERQGIKSWEYIILDIICSLHPLKNYFFFLFWRVCPSIRFLDPPPTPPSYQFCT